MPPERLLKVRGVDLCVETFGDPAAPALLLIAGSTGSMLSWEDELCARLAAGPRHVIRYDHRDTGRSVTYPPGAPGYTGADLIEDVVGVLDALGLDKAHLVGISMGGGIAQVVALDHPDRVASLTLISTSPLGYEGALPPMSKDLGAYFASAAGEMPDWHDRAAVIEYYVESARPFASRSRPFDEEPWRELGARDFDRSSDLASSMTNHFLLDESGESRDGRLGEIDVPTLVLHGTEDPLFPYGHAVALANEIRGASLVPLEGTGHELPSATWDVAVPAILRHTR
jgi:pimeloyl-ACP methyl ester carboxylesterase